ncbi:UDP-N-acetylglucosamine 2-epimerase (non-hydrolyzing) [Streptomyces sp. CB01881]|uniref:non-hydrolyzing UDP-N-acetylglucosamine 2-epimerase n=1 Tax=Streptomyces sp. CB01881 TaxID=2078691 RepID=UPI003211EC8D
MLDTLHDWIVFRQDGIVRLAGLVSLALVGYMALVFGRFLVYWAGSRHAFRSNRPAEPGDPAAFEWHLAVPCRDEEAAVVQTLDGLRHSAPGAHLWVIDDDSEDATRALVLTAADRDDRLHLVQRRRPHARIGKGAALNAAYREISARLPEGTDRSRVVIGVVDADGRLDPGTLAQVCNGKAPGRPDTGAVQIGVRMRNADDERPLPGRGRFANARARALVRMQDVEFQANNAGMQLLRRGTGSVGLGGNGQFLRLSALDSLTAEEGRAGRPWPERALLEDYESGLELRLAGWRLTHITEAGVPGGAGLAPALPHPAHPVGPGRHAVPALHRAGAALAALPPGRQGPPRPELLTGVGGRPRAGQIAQSLGQLDAAFAEDRPAAVVVQGDTNATLAGALAAGARGIPLVHVEAGLRSFDRAVPEEHNRVMVDHVADLLCAATTGNAANLRAESLDEERIALTGNTVVEVVRRRLPDGDARAALLAAHGVAPDGYVLATVHRPENTNTAGALRAVLTELDRIARARTPVLFPMHPHTRAAVERFALDGLLARIAATGPVGYAEFLGLARHAALLVSDSGGVQEECTVLGRPLLVVRRSTERPEAVDAGFAALVPPGPGLGDLAADWLADSPERLARLAATPSPYGDGLASARIAALTARLSEQPVPAAA